MIHCRIHHISSFSPTSFAFQKNTPLLQIILILTCFDHNSSKSTNLIAIRISNCTVRETVTVGALVKNPLGILALKMIEILQLGGRSGAFHVYAPARRAGVAARVERPFQTGELRDVSSVTSPFMRLVLASIHTCACEYILIGKPMLSATQSAPSQKVQISNVSELMCTEIMYRILRIFCMITMMYVKHFYHKLKLLKTQNRSPSCLPSVFLSVRRMSVEDE